MIKDQGLRALNLPSRKDVSVGSADKAQRLDMQNLFKGLDLSKALHHEGNNYGFELLMRVVRISGQL